MLFQPEPIIVRVVEQPVQDTSIADVIIGAIGLTGFLLITAALRGTARKKRSIRTHCGSRRTRCREIRGATR
jgi:hypothetical protein